MRIPRIPSIIALIFLLGGCSTISTKPLPVAKDVPPETLLREAETLHRQERWHEALTLLNEGVKRHPDHLRITELRSEIKRDWEIRKRNKEDWILVLETRALRQKIPHLEELAAIDPNNLITKSRLLFWTNLLESRMAGLIACGSVHLHLDQALAEACASLAEQIKPTPESGHLLAKIKQSHTAQKLTERTRQAVREKRDTAQQRERLLKQARAQLADDALADAIASLQRLLEVQPEDSEARELLVEVTRLRDQRVINLIAFGDVLYRDEKIEQAVSVWEAAGKLDVDRPEVANRLERAMKVLERLREIQENP